MTSVETMILNKNGLEITKCAKNKYKLRFHLENNNIYIEKIIDFPIALPVPSDQQITLPMPRDGSFLDFLGPLLNTDHSLDSPRRETLSNGSFRPPFMAPETA